MKISKFVIGCFIFLIVGGCSSFIFAQETNECNINKIKKPKFNIVGKSNGDVFASNTKVFIIDIVVKPKYQTDHNLVLLANYLKKKYCKENKILAFVFDTKKDARGYEVYKVKKLPDILRAIYSINHENEEEYLVRTKVVNGKIEKTPILIKTIEPKKDLSITVLHQFIGTQRTHSYERK